MTQDGIQYRHHRIQDRYKALAQQSEHSDDELDELMDLELYLDNIPDYLMPSIAADYQKLRLECVKENKR